MESSLNNEHIDILRALEEKRLRRKIAALTTGRKKRKGLIRIMAYGIAASLLVLLMGRIWLLQEPRLAPDLVVDNLNQPLAPEVLELLKPAHGFGAQSDSLFSSAIQSYQKGNYHQTLVQLEVLEQKNLQAEIHYLKGMSHIGLGQHDAAKKVLSQIDPSLLSGKIYLHAQWGLALLALAREDVSEARRYLESMMRHSSDYTFDTLEHQWLQKAENLLNTLSP